MLHKILLIDDEPDILRIAELSLSRVGGWQVSSLLDGSHVHRQVSIERPDLILLDVMMPTVDGTDILQQLKANPESKDIPIILMTARVQPTEVALYLELGADGVIQKPFDPTSLPAEIRRLMSDT